MSNDAIRAVSELDVCEVAGAVLTGLMAAKTEEAIRPFTQPVRAELRE